MKYEKLRIEITNENYFDKVEELEDCIKLYSNNILKFRVYRNSKVDACNSSKVYAYDNSTVYAYDNSTVYATASSTVYAKDRSTVHAYDSSIVRAYDSSKVNAYDSSNVYAYEFTCIYIKSHKVKTNTINHFGAVIKQVHKLKKDILVYKKLQDDKIATLKLVKGQTFQSERFGKCRTDKALVVAITNIANTEEYQTGISVYYDNCIYEVGKEVIADGYDKTIEECSNGIHFFLTREKAEKYEL